MVRDGKVRLYDWGLNYNEWYPQEEVLEDDNGISYENLARYDSASRSGSRSDGGDVRPDDRR